MAVKKKKTAKKANKIKRRVWSKIDVREFKALAKKKTPAPKLAKIFKRTVGAIRQKAVYLKISLDSRR